jgi:hypothetical protein
VCATAGTAAELVVRGKLVVALQGSVKDRVSAEPPVDVAADGVHFTQE